ncbi:MAG: PAS domain-containing protein [Patescibacteria group bacterium]|jgi:PAS domain S-box-containing protein
MPKSRSINVLRQTTRKRAVLQAVPFAWIKRLPTPCFVLDKDARFIFANDSFLELTGYHRRELTRARFDTLLANAGIRDGLKDLLDLYQGHAMSAIAHDFVRKNGSKTHVVMDIAPAYEKGSKKVTHAIGCVLSHKRI